MNLSEVAAILPNMAKLNAILKSECVNTLKFLLLLESWDGFRAAATSKMERFVIIVNGSKPLTIIPKSSILDVAAALDPPLGKSVALLERVCWRVTLTGKSLLDLIISLWYHIGIVISTGILFVDFNLASCDFLRFTWFKMLNSYEDFSFKIFSLRMTVVSVKTLENWRWFK